MSTNEQRSTADAVAKYEKQVGALQGHAVAALGSLAIIFAVNMLTNLVAGIGGDIPAWWSLWAIFGSSAGLGVHGFVVWLNRPA